MRGESQRYAWNAWNRDGWFRFVRRHDMSLNLLRGSAILVTALLVLVHPTASFAFYEHGDINEYLFYDRLKVITPIEEKNTYHPKVRGRLINKTDERVQVSLRLYFYDIFNQCHNHATLSLSMQPKEKVEFEQYLNGSEWERTRSAHHIEFEILNLIVGGRNMTK